MNSATRHAMAQRIVNRLLMREDRFQDEEDFEARPGGPKDPHRQTTVKLAFGKKDFTGKRGTKPVAPEPKPGSKPKAGDGSLMKKRFTISFSEGSGKAPKRSYAEAVMAQVLEKLKKKEGNKPKPIAKVPGKVKYRQEGEVMLDPDRAPGAHSQMMATEEPPAPEPEAGDAPAPNRQNLDDFIKNATPEEWQAAGARSPLRDHFLRAEPKGNWEAFWNEARQEALSDPSDTDYIETLKGYLMLGESLTVPVYEKMKSRTKKLLGAIAKRPGKVAYGRR